MESPTFSRRIPELDGLRGTAILMVLIFHLQIAGFLRVGKPLSRVVGLGSLGVDLFFVLSGFLITSILIETKDSTNYFSSFYARRSLRIFPVCFVCILLYFHAWTPLTEHIHFFGGEMNPPANAVRSDELWYWLYISNWRDWLTRGGFASHWLGHFWSLAVEEQFYLFWPLAIYLCPRPRLPHLFAGVIVVSFLLSVAAEFGGAAAETVHRLTIFRLDTFALGAMVALILRNSLWTKRISEHLRVIFPTSTIAALLAIAAFGHIPHVPWISIAYLSAAACFSCAVFLCVSASGSVSWFSRSMRLPWLRKFGKYSYAMYVFHGPIYHLVQLLFIFLISSRLITAEGIWLSAMRWAEILISFGATYLVALISWRCIERPILKFKSRFTYSYPSAEISVLANAE
jgi:peptidoglycan/LPS O-acetylase OafA/YrhL